jgi:hypothetical protein
VVRVMAVRTLVCSVLGLREREMGAGMSAVRRGELLALLYGWGERGGQTGKGIRRPVVVASMPAVQFGGEGK